MESLYVLIAGVAIVALFVIYTYNLIVKQGNAVQRAWADVITYERGKLAVLEKIENMVKTYSSFEEGMLTSITRLRQHIDQLPKSADGSTLNKIEAQTSQLMKTLQVQVEAYPELKTSSLYQQVMQEITEQQDNVNAAITLFNMSVEGFNNTIETFPNSMVNSMLNKRAIVNPFTDATSSKSFEYQPNLPQ